jgi:transcriptional regulator with XRE-family HTH domain
LKNSKLVIPSKPMLDDVRKEKYELHLNDRLRSLRKAHGKTLKEMCEIVEVSISTFAGYEASKNSNNHRIPSLEKIVKLANYFGVSVDYLIGATDLKPQYSPLDVTELAEKAGLEPHIKATFDYAISQISEYTETGV